MMSVMFEAAFNSGDVERILALYQPNAVPAQQPNQRAIGLAAIRQALGGFLCMSGTIARLQGSWTLSAQGADGKSIEAVRP